MGSADSPCSILIRRNVNGRRLSFCQNKQRNMHLSISQLSALSPGAQSNQLFHINHCLCSRFFLWQLSIFSCLKDQKTFTFPWMCYRIRNHKKQYYMYYNLFFSNSLYLSVPLTLKKTLEKCSSQAHSSVISAIFCTQQVFRINFSFRWLGLHFRDEGNEEQRCLEITEDRTI